MNNVVYLLGAGFSAPLDLPVMKNFLEKSKDLYFQDKEKYAYFSDVFDTIRKMSFSKNYYNTNLENIEEILSILEMGETVGDDEEKGEFKRYIIDVIEAYTPKLQPGTLPNWYDYILNNDLLNAYAYFVLSLFNVSAGGENRHFLRFEKNVRDNPTLYNVITLNYDAILENICSSINSFYTVGSTLELEFKQNFEITTNHQPILAKLHGSVLTKKIIPPTWNKTLEEDDNIKTSWKLAHRCIKEANYIRILGYSLPETDSYIKYLLKSAIINSENLKKIDVLCLDTDGYVKKNYDNFINFSNYRFVSMDLTNYLTYLKTYTCRPYSADEQKTDLKYVDFEMLEEVHEEIMEAEGNHLYRYP